MLRMLPEIFLAAFQYFTNNDTSPHNPVKGNSFIPQDDRIASVLPIQLKVLRGTRVIKVANKLKCTLFSNGARGTVVRVHSKDNSTSVNVTGVSVVC